MITVGAVDAPRFITNDVASNGQTNDTFFGWTDNADLVAWFSGCGNVGVGIEGTYGRFKPDVVAPGVFTISCRATNYVDPTNAEYLTTYPFPDQVVLPGQTNDFSLLLPSDAGQLVGIITPNAQSPAPFPNLEILGGTTTPPTAVLGADNFLSLSNGLTAGEWYFGVTTPAGQIQPVAYDLTFYLFETNDLGLFTSNGLGYFQVISNLNSVLKPAGYVYQYGTSMSAGAVSGMLALMQEFLQARLGLTNPSPALLKAMLINGSRSVEQQYDFNLAGGLGQRARLGPAQPAQQRAGLADQRHALAGAGRSSPAERAGHRAVANLPRQLLRPQRDQLSHARHAGVDRSAGGPGRGHGAGQQSGPGGHGSFLHQRLAGQRFFQRGHFHRGRHRRSARRDQQRAERLSGQHQRAGRFPADSDGAGHARQRQRRHHRSNEIAQDFALVISSDDPDLKGR